MAIFDKIIHLRLHVNDFLSIPHLIRFIPVHIHLFPSAPYSPAISSPLSQYSLLSSLSICNRRSLPPDLDYEIDSSVFFSPRWSFHLLPAHSLSITMKCPSEIVLDFQNVFHSLHIVICHGFTSADSINLYRNTSLQNSVINSFLAFWLSCNSSMNFGNW